MTSLTPGSLVQLKSGGPVMTLERIARHGESAECLWFVTPGELRRQWFNLDSIQLHTGPEKEFDADGIIAAEYRFGQD